MLSLKPGNFPLPPSLPPSPVRVVPLDGAGLVPEHLVVRPVAGAVGRDRAGGVAGVVRGGGPGGRGRRLRLGLGLALVLGGRLEQASQLGERNVGKGDPGRGGGGRKKITKCFFLFFFLGIGKLSSWD